MQTRELTAMLAAHVEPTPPAAPGLGVLLAAAVGVAGALWIMFTWMGLRPDIAAAAGTPIFWTKLAFPITLGIVAVLTMTRLSRPGVPVARVATLLPLPVLAVWMLSAGALIIAPPAARHAMVWGETWMVCPLNIAGLAMPAFLATLWAVSRLAPTRTMATGAVAGLLGGTVGAAVYALHCPEAGMAFLGIWYLLGMALPAAAGAMIGPRILRW